MDTVTICVGAAGCAIAARVLGIYPGRASRVSRASAPATNGPSRNPAAFRHCGTPPKNAVEAFFSVDRRHINR